MTTATPLPEPAPAYPVTLKIDYPDRKLNHLTSFFRIFIFIPIAIVLGAMSGPYASWANHGNSWSYGFSGALILFLPTLLMLLFRKKYPKWWFDWNLNVTKFAYRVTSYFALMTDVYPSTDDEQSVHVDMIYPDVQKELMRGMPLVKWFLAIPHYVVLVFLAVAAVVCLIIAWFAILFSGSYPKGLFNFIEGVYRWELRVAGYAFLLVTDKYPPFSLD